MQVKALALTALASTAAAQMSLTQALNSSSELTSLNNLLANFPNLTAQISGLSNITLLAPSNAAISALLNSSVGAMAAAMPALVEGILTYHVLNGTYATFGNNTAFIRTALQPPTYTNVTGGQRVETRGSGANATIYSGLKTNSSAGAAMNFTGGVIHIVDRVLSIPGNISSTAIAFNLTSAAGALTAANLVNTVDTTSDLTVFVPNNAAFQRIGSALPNLTMQEITSILEYHVVAGTVGYSSLLSNTSLATLQGGNLTITVHNASSVYVNSARVLIPDVLVANGVVHVIDNVLNPSNTATANSTQSTGAPAYSGASSVSNVPYTSGVPTPTSSIDTSSVAATATGGSGSGAGSSSSSSGVAWMAKPTGLGVVLLAGGAIVLAL